MRVSVESSIEENADGCLAPLIGELKRQTFAESCCIGELAGSTIYIKCLRARHGIIADGASMDAENIARIIEMLRASVGCST